ncbi:MAG: 30S ribosomal protein S26e [Nitrososphaerales archaeon]
MTKKRKSRGRAKGGKGRSEYIHCSNCGRLVARDKAKKFTSRVSLVEPSLAKELKAAGAHIENPVTVKYYCISCAVHYGLIKVRAKDERKLR